jgi:hypothetical protein
VNNNKAQGARQWDNRILDFDGEDYVCIGRTARYSLKANAYIMYELEKASIDVTMINDEVWVPLARAYFALEALKGSPMFCQISTMGDWSVEASVPDDKNNFQIGTD